MKGFVLSLVLRHKGTRKWPVYYLSSGPVIIYHGGGGGGLTVEYFWGSLDFKGHKRGNQST